MKLAFLDQKSINENWGALRSPRAIVKVIEATAQALVEDVGSAQREGTVIARRETSCDDGTCLRGSIKLELVIGGDISRPPILVLENTILKGDCKRPLFVTDDEGGSN